MERRRIIVTLLDWYRDVESSWYEAGDGTFGQPLMHRAWNHPSYRELRRLLGVMRVEAPELHWAVRARYVLCDLSPRDVKRRSGRWLVGANEEVVRSGYQVAKRATAQTVKQQQSAFAPGVHRVVVRRWNGAVRPEDVDAGVRWLEERWRGDPFVPREIESGMVVA